MFKAASIALVQRTAVCHIRPSLPLLVKDVYVGNLQWAMTDVELKDAFSAHGQINRAVIVMDRMTGRSRGFGFVQFEDDKEADEAILKMDGSDLNGRTLRVNAADRNA